MSVLVVILIPNVLHPSICEELFGYLSVIQLLHSTNFEMIRHFGKLDMLTLFSFLNTFMRDHFLLSTNVIVSSERNLSSNLLFCKY